jgi:hypothetical protein
MSIWGRGFGATILAILACVTTIAAVTAAWSSYELLNTNRFVAKVAPLASDPAVQDALSARLTAEVDNLIDPQAFFERVLPEQGAILAVPLGAAVDRWVADKVDAFVRSDQFAQLWEQGIRAVHSAAVTILEGDLNGKHGVLTNENGQAYLNLEPAIELIVQQLASAAPSVFNKIDVSSLTSSSGPALQHLESALGITLPADYGKIPVFRTDKITAAQTALRQFKRLTLLLLILAPLLAVAAVAASVRRRRMVLLLGLSVALGLIATRRIIFRVEEDLLDLIKPENRAAAGSILHDVLGSYLGLLIGLAIGGLVVALVAFLVGPARPAKRARSGAQSLGSKVRSTVTDRSDGSAGDVLEGWMTSYRDPIRLGVAVFGVLVLVIANVSWAWIFFILIVFVGIEIALSLAFRPPEGEIRHT